MVTELRVQEVLRHPENYTWTIQGFGMLRTYLDDQEVDRLHIWDVNTANADVSVIHNHPWDFDSRIYYGGIINQRYALALDHEPHEETVKAAMIRTGEGGGLIPDSITNGLLHHYPEEFYGPGEVYHMNAPELHESIPATGTVSVISRRFHTARDDQVAIVCWRQGDWVTAEPRPATSAEVMHFIYLARQRAGIA